MKTALTEWFDELKANYPYMANEIFDKGFNKYLEKEKKQIIDAWEKGYSTGCVVGSNDYTNEDEEKDNGNYYYNQTYNQNK